MERRAFLVMISGFSQRDVPSTTAAGSRGGNGRLRGNLDRCPVNCSGKGAPSAV